MASVFTPQERFESVKAGLIAAVTGLGCSVAWYVLALTTGGLVVSPEPILDVAITTVCTFLFGATYRYIIRKDQRSHLKSGAVGAFALVRGLSQLEGSWSGSLSWLDGVTLVESFAIFAIAQFALDSAMRMKRLTPFGDSSIASIQTDTPPV